MESKFIIFLAFASLALGAEKLKVSYGLSKRELAVLSEVISNQKTAMTAYLEGFNPIFDKIDRLLVGLIFNFKPTSYNDSQKLAEGLVKVKNAVDISLDSVSLILGKSCCAVKGARRKTHDNLDDVFERITAALELADSGNCGKNQAAIEMHREEVEKDITNLVKTVYNSISTCLGKKDRDTLRVIRDTEDRSRIGLVHVNNAIFNAIESYADASVIKSSEIALVFEIENLRKLATLGLKDDIEYKFSALKTLFISSKTRQAGIVSGWSIFQYAQTVASHRYGEAMEVIFGTIFAYMKEVDLKYKDDGKLDFAPADAALKEGITKFDAGNAAIFESMKVLHPNNTDAIVAAQKEMSALEVIGVTEFYVAIFAAADTAANKSYSETINTIEAIRDRTVSLASGYTGAFFQFLRIDQIFSPEINAQIIDLNEKAIHIDKIAMNVFFDAIRILARIVREKKVRDGDFSDVQALLARSMSGLDDFTQYVAAASLIVLKVFVAL